MRYNAFFAVSFDIRFLKFFYPNCATEKGSGIFTVTGLLLPFLLWNSYNLWNMPILLLVIGALMFLWYAGFSAMSLVVGERVLELSSYRGHSVFRRLVVGASVLFPAFTIPLLGWLLLFITIVVCVGAATLVLVSAFTQHIFKPSSSKFTVENLSKVLRQEANKQ